MNAEPVMLMVACAWMMLSPCTRLIMLWEIVILAWPKSIDVEWTVIMAAPVGVNIALPDFVLAVSKDLAPCMKVTVTEC